MKSRFDLKHNIGKITPQSLEDLIILKEVLTPGILVTAKTPRSVKIRREGRLIRAKSGRREVVLTINVEKIDLEEELRLTGKIVGAPEHVERGYHTIEVEPKTFLKIEKEWKGWEIDRIKSAERKPEPILICVLDDREADFYLLKERYRHLLNLSSEAVGKRFEAKKFEVKQEEYYKKILNELKKKFESVKRIVIAGPAFTKDTIHRLIKEREKEFLGKIMIESTFHTGNVGLQELLRKGLVERITKFSRVTEETKAVEILLREITKNGKGVYSFEKTKEALEAGAVELLLVSDKKIREFENLLELADKMKVKIMVISTSHENGEKLFGLGGIGAILRYKIS